MEALQVPVRLLTQKPLQDRWPRSLPRQLMVVKESACAGTGMLIALLYLEIFFVQKLKELSDA